MRGGGFGKSGIGLAQRGEQVHLRLVVADDGVDVAEAGLFEGVLGLEDVDGQQGAGVEVGAGEAEGFIGGIEALAGHGNQGGVGEAGLMRGDDGGADLIGLAQDVDGGGFFFSAGDLGLAKGGETEGEAGVYVGFFLQVEGGEGAGFVGLDAADAVAGLDLWAQAAPDDGVFVGNHGLSEFFGGLQIGAVLGGHRQELINGHVVADEGDLADVIDAGDEGYRWIEAQREGKGDGGLVEIVEGGDEILMAAREVGLGAEFIGGQTGADAEAGGGDAFQFLALGHRLLCHGEAGLGQHEVVVLIRGHANGFDAGGFSLIFGGVEPAAGSNDVINDLAGV